MIDASAKHESDLLKLIRYDSHIHAHVLCEICGIKPATLRQARWRARKSGMSDPLPTHAKHGSRHVVTLRDAVSWLQSTGRHIALLRLAEWYDDASMAAKRDMRGYTRAQFDVAGNVVSNFIRTQAICRHGVDIERR